MGWGAAAVGGAHPVRQGLLVGQGHAVERRAQLVLLVPSRVQVRSPA